MVRNVFWQHWLSPSAAWRRRRGVFAASITLTPEADTFVRALRSGRVRTAWRRPSTSTAARRPTAAASARPAGLLRFDLSSIPAGATITGAKLELTSFTGFAFDGDPEHHASFVPDDSLGGGLGDVEHAAAGRARAAGASAPSGCSSAALSAPRRRTSAQRRHSTPPAASAPPPPTAPSPLRTSVRVSPPSAPATASSPWRSSPSRAARPSRSRARTVSSSSPTSSATTARSSRC